MDNSMSELLNRSDSLSPYGFMVPSYSNPSLSGKHYKKIKYLVNPEEEPVEAFPTDEVNGSFTEVLDMDTQPNEEVTQGLLTKEEFQKMRDEIFAKLNDQKRISKELEKQNSLLNQKQDALFTRVKNQEHLSERLKKQNEQQNRDQAQSIERMRKQNEQHKKNQDRIIEHLKKQNSQNQSKSLKTLKDLNAKMDKALKDVKSQMHKTDQLSTKIMNKAYPVGSIYMSVKDIDPKTLFGGKWERWGTGRVPVGVDTKQPAFSSVEKVGGEAAHTLTTAELPSFTYVDSQGSPLWAPTSGQCWLNNRGGGNQPHNNLQPYITCFMWKRVA